MGQVIALHDRELASGAPAGAAGRAASRTLVRGPELAELRGFCAAVDLGSIGRAARLLRISQPALSKRLSGLECVAGTRLLDRSTRGVTATPAGADLYRAARRLLADSDAVEALMRGFSADTAPVIVAASPTIAEWWLPGALVNLERAHERHLSVELITANSTTVRRMVRSGQAEIGFAAVDPDAAAEPDLTEMTIWEDELVIGVPHAHAWAQVDQVNAAEFAATPLIRRDPGANSSRVVETALRAVGLTAVAPVAEIGSTSTACAAAVAENVPVIVTAAALTAGTHGLVVRRVAGVRFERRFVLVVAGWLEDLAPSGRALARFLLGGRGQ
jgi:DNA-binding transcriptional LysR family regulator